jgi:hypothetical protein
MQENPGSTICRDLAALKVPAKKYLTAARQLALKRCRQILHTDDVYRATFKTSME